MNVHANTETSTSSDWSSPMRRPALTVLAPISLTLVALSGCGASGQTVQGSIQLIAACSVDGGYDGFDDIHAGASVEISDAAGAVIALGQLDVGERSDEGFCTYPFSIDEVPTGHEFYGVQVGNEARGTYTVPAAEIAEPVEMSLSAY